MHSPLGALTWEIWRRNRRLIVAVIALALAGGMFNLLVTDHVVWQALNGLLMAGSLMLAFGAANFTESNPEREWSGFPYRLFTLPVSTAFLVIVPVTVGVFAIELVYWSWAKLIYPAGEIRDPLWFAGLLAAFMVFYQAVVWCLAGFRFTRMLVLGLGGPLFVLIACLPFSDATSSLWFSEKFWALALAGFTAVSFGCAWFFVARQRCGGGRRRNSLAVAIERIADLLPRRKKEFTSAAGAHFWFEWRRSGYLLPLGVGCVLVIFIGPLSWLLRDDPGANVLTLVLILALPLVLATPIGKGFSKPDFWARELKLPSFIAIRPLATGELIVVKMKVAAASAVLSWLLVLAFFSVWFPLWANLEFLNMVRIGFWMVYDHTLFPQYAIAALFLIAGTFVTWKLLVGGLWIGSSGNQKLFTASALICIAAPVIGFIAITMAAHRPAIRQWVHDRPNDLLAIVEWTMALAVIAKFWMAAITWRHIAPGRVRKFALAWFGGTLCLIALAILIWANGTLSMFLLTADFLPLDVIRLRNLLILIALLVLPFARMGLAPSMLAKNRREGSNSTTNRS